MSQTKAELQRFLVAGLMAVGTDLGSYQLLYDALGHDLAKALSFILGSVVAYVVNKLWTFKADGHKVKEAVKFTLLYCSTLGANVLVNRLSLVLFDHLLLAFFLATGTSTVLNFLGMKFWVFKSLPE